GLPVLGRLGVLREMTERRRETSPRAHVLRAPAEHWQALLEIAPGDPEAELELGTHLRELGRGEEAKPLLERAAARRSGRAFFELGLLARQAGEREQAVTHLEKALEIQPQQPRAALELGRTLIALGRKKQGDQWLETHEKLQAAEDARRGARVEGQLALMEADRLYSQAREEVKQGRIAEAKSSYGRTLELDPAHHGARIELAWLHMADGQHRPAERELRLVLKQEPEHPQGLLAWGILCVETGRFDEARQSLGRSRASGTWLPTVAQQVGRAWRSVGQEEEARRWESGR
ncbi:MAG: tetratricopeptide repeat protein, partial [Acidobacteriota bacterium]